MTVDPRLAPLTKAACEIVDRHNYNPHFASLAEQATIETVLFLARYDALVRYYDEHGVPMPEKPANIGGGEMIPIIDPEKSNWRVDVTHDLVEVVQPTLPDCMLIPDTVNPCAGYQQLRADADRLAEHNNWLVREMNRSAGERRVAKSPALSAPYGFGDPIPMILFCPACDLQHIDAEEPHKPECAGEQGADFCNCDRWTNPPHRSHKCAGCGEVWRPADVATVGVRDIETRGNYDAKPIRGQAGRQRFRMGFWRHKERMKDYNEIGRGELQMSTPVVLKEKDRLVCYRGLDGKFWFRLEAEFDDGRFEKLD